MRRYWIPEEFIQGEDIFISGDILKHIRDVCRLDVGSKFELLTDQSIAYFVELKSMAKKEAVACIIDQRQIPTLPKPFIKLAVSLPRYAKMDAIVEKSVELGVESLHPFLSEFSFVRKASALSANKLQRWPKIVQGATQQSGRGSRMKVEEPLPMAQVLEKINQNPAARGLFLYEGECHKSIKQALKEVGADVLKGQVDEIWLVIGSEGGFSTAEVEFMKSKGLEPITMGEQVLRVETACLAAVSMARVILL